MYILINILEVVIPYLHIFPTSCKVGQFIVS